MSDSWKFDAQVAANFDSHARRHIPDYDSVLDDAILLARQCCAPSDPILEVGCATGETLRRLQAAGFANLTGVDNSSDMLARCDASGATLILSDTFPAERAPFRLVLSNWTLHFVAPEPRLAYFRAIHQGLHDGGYLMLSEKCVQSPLMTALYHGWKRDGGMSREEIDSKAKALEGVMKSMPAGWTINALESLGFAVDIWRAASGFVTFVAQKKAAA